LRLGLELDDESELATVLLAAAVLCDRRGDSRMARELAAATGFDLDAPSNFGTHRHRVSVRALEALREIFIDQYEAAAVAGRRLGVRDAARNLARRFENDDAHRTSSPDAFAKSDR
jgi:hypothetical protein